MQFSTVAVFATILGFATAAPAELDARQQQKQSAIAVCTDGTFADAVATIVPAVCVSTYGCEGGTAPLQSGKTWTAGCVGCPSGQTANKFSNCLFAYI